MHLLLVSLYQDGLRVLLSTVNNAREKKLIMRNGKNSLSDDEHSFYFLYRLTCCQLSITVYKIIINFACLLFIILFSCFLNYMVNLFLAFGTRILRGPLVF